MPVVNRPLLCGDSGLLSLAEIVLYYFFKIISSLPLVLFSLSEIPVTHMLDLLS